MPFVQVLSEVHGKKVDRPFRSVYDILTYPGPENGSKIAVVCMHQPADLYSVIVKGASTAEYLRWSFDEIIHVSHVMALALTESGIRSGMTIAAFVENNIESQILFRASLELNCTLALLNPKSTSNQRELLHFFGILQPSIVVVPNLSIAKIVDEVVSESMKGVLLKLVCGEKENYKHWKSFGTFLEGCFASNQAITSPLSIERKEEDIILIFFTSGTTSLPKGVPHTNSSIASILLNSPTALAITETSVSCSHFPFFHLFGLEVLGYFNARACTAVIPSAAFNPKASLRAISLEGTNFFPSVPAMNSALLNHSDFKKSSIIEEMVMSTNAVTPEYLTRTVTEFGAKRIFDGYGSTETGAIWIHRTGTKPSADTYPRPEVSLRVCDPDTDQVLPRGVRGELHCCGKGVTPRYLLSKEQGEGPNSAFYDDDFGHWFRTGDQVVMNDNGEIRVIGRYKDLIIRGGENLSPRFIELVMAEEFGLVVEVIGIPDEVVGEVPVGVIKETQNYDMTDIRGKLVKKLGPLFALEDIITLKSIGLEDFPKTYSGKTKKNILREKVIEYYLKAETSRKEGNGHNGHKVHNEENEFQVETLTTLWSKHLGISNLHPQQNILEFADSLTLARFPALLRRSTGHSLGLQELLDNPTIEAQAQILLARKIGQVGGNTEYSKVLSVRAGPPTSNDMIHAMGDEDVYSHTKALCQQVLLPLKLSWNDVEDVIPMQPTMKRMLERRRPQSSNHRHTWLCRGKTLEELEEALKKALAHHSTLLAMSIHYDSKTPMHLILRPSQTLFSQMFRYMPPVENAQELWRQSYNNQDDWAAEPGPLFRATLSYVKQENCAGLVYVAQHSIYDAISLEMFMEDLDALLVDPKTPLMPRVPYKAWADSYYNLQHSETAQRSLIWQARRLKGISNHKKSRFPEQRAPEWFKGSSDGWKLPNGIPGPSRKALDGGLTDGVLGTARHVKLHDAKLLKHLYAIELPQVAKAALAIVNVRRTKTNVALFGQHQAARAWPFLPDWQTKLLPDAMNVGGPTMQTTAVMVDVNSTYTVAKLILKLQEEQVGLNAHSHAPHDQLIDRLNEDGSKDGDTLREIIRRQMFNWLPGGVATEYQSLQNVQSLSRADVGISWNCSMISEDILRVRISWDDAQLSGKEAVELLDEFSMVVEQVSKMESWEKTIGELA